MNFDKAFFGSNSTTRIGALVAVSLLAPGFSGCLANVVTAADAPMPLDDASNASSDAAPNPHGNVESRPAPACSEAVVVPGLGTYAGSTLGSTHRYPDPYPAANRCGDGTGPAVLYALWLDRPTDVMVTYWAATGATLRIGPDCGTIGSGACTTPVDPPAAVEFDDTTWAGIGGTYGPGYFYAVVETLGSSSDFRIRFRAL